MYMIFKDTGLECRLDSVEWRGGGLWPCLAQQSDWSRLACFPQHLPLACKLLEEYHIVMMVMGFMID